MRWEYISNQASAYLLPQFSSFFVICSSAIFYVSSLLEKKANDTSSSARYQRYFFGITLEAASSCSIGNQVIHFRIFLKEEGVVKIEYIFYLLLGWRTSRSSQCFLPDQIILIFHEDMSLWNWYFIRVNRVFQGVFLGIEFFFQSSQSF